MNGFGHKFAALAIVLGTVAMVGCGSDGKPAAGSADALATSDTATKADTGSTDITQGPQLAADRPILLWSDGQALAQNAPHVPKDLVLPDQTVCAKDAGP